MTEESPAFIPPNYTLGQKLGSGQTSHVFLATHPQFGKVALKLPRDELHDRPVLRRMFENEVQITLGLRHRNLVAAMDGRPTGRQAFLALEYCSGGTLDQLLLEAGQLPLERAVRLASDVAAGLQQSHAQQVLHRDVKPANVFLTEDGVAKLGDFGTGRYMTDEIQDRVGTAFYMAPEIFEGGAATVASDIYSLGILAYEVLSGSRPFVGDTLEQIMYAHLSGLPKPIEYHRPGTSRSLTNVVSRAMSREAAKRYTTVEAFRRDFEKAAGIAVAAPGVTTGRLSRRAAQEQEQEKESGERPRGLFGWLRRR